MRPRTDAVHPLLHSHRLDVVRSHRLLRHVRDWFGAFIPIQGEKLCKHIRNLNPHCAARWDCGAAIAIVIGNRQSAAGIFLSLRTCVSRSVLPGMVFVVWIFGGILTLFGALTYAELSAALPDAGGEYVYLTAAYGPFFGFIYGWTQTWVAKAASIATLATGFYTYLADFLPGLKVVSYTIPLTDRSRRQFARNSVRPIAGNRPDIVPGIGELPGSARRRRRADFRHRAEAGADRWVNRRRPHLQPWSRQRISTWARKPSRAGIPGCFAALVAALWAYDGWNNAGMLGSEIERPQRNLPLALISGTLMMIAVYLLTNLAYFYVLSGAEVGAAERVAATMMRRVMGQPGGAVVAR